MKGLIGRLILLAILGAFLYRNRNSLFKLVLIIEGVRHLCTSMNFRWADTGEWLKHRFMDRVIDRVETE